MRYWIFTTIKFDSPFSKGKGDGILSFLDEDDDDDAEIGYDESWER